MAQRTGTVKESIQLVGHIVEAGALNEEKHDVRVTVVKGGKSVNGFYYDSNALRAISNMLEGARAYADHGRSAADEATRSVRDIIGFYRDAQFIPNDPVTPLGRVEATLHVMEAAGWLWSMIQEAVNLGKPDLIGLSIDIFGIAEQDQQLQARAVKKVVALNSCDVVTRPSAGGAFQRILHDSIEEGDEMNPKKKPGTEELEEQQQEQELQPPTQITEQQHQPPTSPPVPPSAILQIQEAESQRIMNELRTERCAVILERRLLECILPEAARERIKAGFKGRIFEESELDTEISAMQTMLADMTNAGLIRGHGYEKPTIGGQITEAEKVQAAFDSMFGLEIDTTRMGNVRGFTSIREAYARVTGDSTVAGGISSQSRLGMIAISEHAPITRISEADTTTASFSYLLGTSMNKRLLKDYQAWPWSSSGEYSISSSSSP
jgi:hypothetical protein